MTNYLLPPPYRDLKRVEDGLAEKLGLAIYNASTAVIAILTAFFYGWKLTLIIISLLPFLAFGTAIMNKVFNSLVTMTTDNNYSLEFRFSRVSRAKKSIVTHWRPLLLKKRFPPFGRYSLLVVNNGKSRDMRRV